jgi:hypothetical protein
MTKDEFRRLQKSQCPPQRGKRRGNRSVYGCECCRPHGDFAQFKKECRAWARKELKEELREELKAYQTEEE